jgi:NAD(P)H-hydrate repair Nnr-like enzyme with NAD(P)H-hydrate dehydratase domain
MEELMTIKITDKKAKKVIKSLEEINFIKVISNPGLGLTAKKKKQAKDFLSALQQAKLAEQGKIKLKTAQSLLDEL